MLLPDADKYYQQAEEAIRVGVEKHNPSS
jgi:hypothetical protein